MISGESELAQMIVASTPFLSVKSRMRRFQSGSRRVDDQGGAGLARHLVRLRIDVDADDDAAGRQRDAGAELADQSEPVDGDHLAELQVGTAQRLHGDPADRDEGGVAQVDVRRGPAPRG